MKRHFPAYKGGSGSANFGHGGRPGEVGGSSEGGRTEETVHENRYKLSREEASLSIGEANDASIQFQEGNTGFKSAVGNLSYASIDVQEHLERVREKFGDSESTDTAEELLDKADEILREASSLLDQNEQANALERAFRDIERAMDSLDRTTELGESREAKTSKRFYPNPLSKEQGGTVGAFLESKIHEVFTVTADRMFQMGLIKTTEERISVSSCIGDALEALRKATKDKCADLMGRAMTPEQIKEMMDRTVMKGGHGSGNYGHSGKGKSNIGRLNKPISKEPIPGVSDTPAAADANGKPLLNNFSENHIVMQLARVLETPANDVATKLLRDGKGIEFRIKVHKPEDAAKVKSLAVRTIDRLLPAEFELTEQNYKDSNSELYCRFERV